ncbi:MAG: hypothetical protein ABL876_18590, partial [Chitinophagaceae bacterium]
MPLASVGFGCGVIRRVDFDVVVGAGGIAGNRHRRCVRAGIVIAGKIQNHIGGGEIGVVDMAGID